MDVKNWGLSMLVHFVVIFMQLQVLKVEVVLVVDSYVPIWMLSNEIVISIGFSKMVADHPDDLFLISVIKMVN